MLPLTYRVIAASANAGPGASGLATPNRSARLFFETMTGSLGPISDESGVLLPDVTRDQLRTTLRRLMRDEPDFLVVFLVGHGHAGGFLCTDGTFPFDELARRISAV